MKDNIEKIIHSTLLKNNIKEYPKKDLGLQLEIHPNFPSFQSITDTLDYFNIDNIAVEVPKEALAQLPEHFISLVRNGDYEEIAAITKKNGVIEVAHSDLKQKKFSFEEFTAIWEPKVIAVEKNENATQLKFSKAPLQLVFAIVTVLGIGYLLLQKSWSIENLLFFLIAAGGTILSVFAVRESLGFQSQKLHQFCTSVGKSDCSEVINSDRGKIFKDVSLADSGILFFGSLVAFITLYSFTDSIIVPVLAGVPIVLYSLYSQAFVLKKWCAVCIGMATLFIALAGLSYTYFPLNIKINELITFAFLFSVLAITYFFIKNKIVATKELKSNNVKLNQFKRDEQLFNHLLSLSETIKDTQTFEHEIILGNPNAGFKLISSTNPMCGFCKDAFEAYRRVYRTLSDNLQIVIRLKVNADDLENNATIISLILLEIYNSQGQEAFIEAYTAWFEDRTFANWIKKYDTVAYKNSPYIEVLKKQSKWAEDNHLMYTPATVINGSLYPKKYSYDEFFHFVNIMVEDYQEKFNQAPMVAEAQ
ncbi:vitamin K epoxide reductase family protein [Aquimarina brevivitae]|uniref:Thioredoxin-like protein n=1 Tax=Aquimarina brevivitae TaxID=323412 RepID=A0A4Q7PF66_9FLAO|nr:vitamin K epoxide reductase family protein [Aquimarina brevivitae]RZS98955.1 thioredoxin-like protein [Aquimarina brevivitae]